MQRTMSNPTPWSTEFVTPSLKEIGLNGQRLVPFCASRRWHGGSDGSRYRIDFDIKRAQQNSPVLSSHYLYFGG